MNIFKKYEGGHSDSTERGEVAQRRHTGSLSRDSLPAKTYINVEMPGYRNLAGRLNLVDIMIGNRLTESLVTSAITSLKGFVSQMIEGRVVAVFDDADSAAQAGLRIRENINKFNELRMPRHRLHLNIHIITAGLTILNGEVIDLPEHTLERARRLFATNRLIADGPTVERMGKTFHCTPFAEVTSDGGAYPVRFFELLSPVNFSDLAESMITELIRRDQERLMAQMQIEVELRKRKHEQKTGSAVEYAQAMDDVGRVLREDLAEIVKYIQKRSTDRELISTSRGWYRTSTALPCRDNRIIMR